MKWLSIPAAIIVGNLVFGPSLARAAVTDLPPEMMGRLEILGRFAGDTPFCEAMGYTPLDRDGRVLSHEIEVLATRAGASPTDAATAVEAARKLEGAELQAGYDAMKANLKDPLHDRDLRAFADGLAVRCDKAVSDPVASVLMKPPRGQVSSISRRFVDSLLTPYGRAGWQSQYLLTGGDLAEAVGACEARLARGQGRAYLAELRDPTRFAPDITDTIQAWLDQRIAAGKEQARKTAPSAAQCHQRLAKTKAAFAKAPVE